MVFEVTHLFFKGVSVKTFTEADAPDWLTSENTIPGSTMDYRWFWKDHVCKLEVGEFVDTDFNRIKRIN